MREEFIKELLQEMNKVRLYEVIDERQRRVKTIKCDTVCAILTVMLDKYFNNEGEE